jgi:integral membrane protein
VAAALTRYRVMAYVVGVLLVVLVLVGVPLANFDGTPMWHVFPSTPDLWATGSTPHQVGEAITTYLGVAHGWLYMIFLVTAAALARRARWPLGFTGVTLLLGTVPILSFVAERRATARVRAQLAADAERAGAGTPA